MWIIWTYKKFYKESNRGIILRILYADNFKIIIFNIIFKKYIFYKYKDEFEIGRR
jgi:hypothetical protein